MKNSQPTAAAGKNRQLIADLENVLQLLATAEENQDSSRRAKVECNRLRSAVETLRARLVIENLPLAYKTAQRLLSPEAKTYVGVEEVQRAAEVALVITLNNWDPSKGEFSTYAMKAISTEVKTLIAKTIGLSRTDYVARGVIVGIQDYLKTELGREPSVDEVAAATKLPKVQVERIMSFSHVAHLDAPSAGSAASSGKALTLGDTLVEKAQDAGVDLSEIRQVASTAIPDVLTFAVWMQLTGAHGGKPESSATAAFLLGEPRRRVSARKVVASRALNANVDI